MNRKEIENEIASISKQYFDKNERIYQMIVLQTRILADISTRLESLKISA